MNTLSHRAHSSNNSSSEHIPYDTFASESEIPQRRVGVVAGLRGESSGLIRITEGHLVRFWEATLQDSNSGLCYVLYNGCESPVHVMLDLTYGSNCSCDEGSFSFSTCE